MLDQNGFTAAARAALNLIWASLKEGPSLEFLTSQRGTHSFLLTDPCHHNDAFDSAGCLKKAALDQVQMWLCGGRKAPWRLPAQVQLSTSVWSGICPPSCYSTRSHVGCRFTNICCQGATRLPTGPPLNRIQPRPQVSGQKLGNKASRKRLASTRLLSGLNGYPLL